MSFSKRLFFGFGGTFRIFDRFFLGFFGFFFGFENRFGVVQSVDGGAVKIFAGEASGFATAFAKVGKVVAADFSAADNLNLLNKRRVEEERFFDTNATRDFSDNDASSVGFFAVDTDNDAFENLRAELFAFFNFLGNLDGVARTDVNNSGLFLGVTDFL